MEIDCLDFGLLRCASAQLDYPDLHTLMVTTKPKEIKTITYDNSKGATDQVFNLLEVNL